MDNLIEMDDLGVPQFMETTMECHGMPWNAMDKPLTYWPGWSTYSEWSSKKAESQGWFLAGWWFGCHEFYFPINIGNVIIPNDELIFFRGVALAHQPVSIFEIPNSNREQSFLACETWGLERLEANWDACREETSRCLGARPSYLFPFACPYHLSIYHMYI